MLTLTRINVTTTEKDINPFHLLPKWSHQEQACERLKKPCIKVFFLWIFCDFVYVLLMLWRIILNVPTCKSHQSMVLLMYQYSHKLGLSKGDPLIPNTWFNGSLILKL